MIGNHPHSYLINLLSVTEDQNLSDGYLSKIPGLKTKKKQFYFTLGPIMFLVV